MAKWISLEMSDDEKLDTIMPLPMDTPDYPCGMCLSFDRTTIDKLGIELPDVGDILDMRCFMEVKSVHDGPNGPCFEAQITTVMDPVENENTEMPEADEDEPRLESRKPLMEQGASHARPGRRRILYRKAAGANWNTNLA